MSTLNIKLIKLQLNDSSPKVHIRQEYLAIRVVIPLTSVVMSGITRVDCFTVLSKQEICAGAERCNRKHRAVSKSWYSD